MTFNNKIQDEIERYANGQMNDEESRSFNQKRKNDANYERQWQNYVLMNAAGKAIEQKRFEQYNNEIEEEQKRNRIIITVLLFLVLSSILAYFVLSKNTVKPSQEEYIFVEEFSTPDKSIIFENNKISTKKTSSITKEDERKELQIAIDNFYLGEYEKAIGTLKRLTQYNPGLLRANFYIGISELELKNYEAALTEFENILDGLDNDGNEDLLEETYWYKSLTLIALKQEDEAIENLEVLSEFSTKYEEKAMLLIAKIQE